MEKQTVESALRELLEANGGFITPQIVLQSAKKQKSPLHSHFNWDDGIAANQWRLSQAAEMIRKVKVTIIVSPTRTVRVRAFLNVVQRSTFESSNADAEEDGEEVPSTAVYVTVENAMKNHREEILAKAMGELNCIKNKYSHLKELVGVWDALDKV